RLLEQPGLYFERVNWDPVGKIAVANGVLDLHSKQFTPWSPQHFLRRKRVVAYDPAAKAPQFDEFLALPGSRRQDCGRADRAAAGICWRRVMRPAAAPRAAPRAVPGRPVPHRKEPAGTALPP